VALGVRETVLVWVVVKCVGDIREFCVEVSVDDEKEKAGG